MEKQGTLFSGERRIGPNGKSEIFMEQIWFETNISFTAYLINQCGVLAIDMTTSYLSRHEENKYFGHAICYLKVYT